MHLQRWIGSLLLASLFLVPPSIASAATPERDTSIRSATTTLAAGVAERTSDIMARQAHEDALGKRPERDNEEKENGRIGPNRIGLPIAPGSPDALAFGTQVPDGRAITPFAANPNETNSPQTVGVNVTTATLSGTYSTGSFPPDNMGAVGPTQFVVFVNGRLMTISKTTGSPDGALNADPDVFFSSVVNGSYTSDPRVRYDRLTGRWFLVIINVSVPNRILLAVSDAASNGTITGATTWTFFYIPIATTPPTISTGCLADYPTMGLDANAIYIGTNDFCSNATTYNGTDLYVVRKSSIMGAGPIVVTAFRQLCTSSGSGPYTPQGVDNYDPAATEGYVIGIDNASYGLLQMRRISNPGGTPTISANIPITVSTWLSPLNSPHLGNTRSSTGYLSCVDDRLFAAHIRNGQLWTAHNVGTTNTGAGTGTATRDGARWYQLNVPVGSGTPTVVQSGLVYTASASNTTDQRNLMFPTVMVSGQGHVAASFASAGTNEYANAGTFGRLSADAAGTMQATALLTAATTAYNPASDPGQAGVGRRWGDYSYVSLDPLDDMTMWSVTQFCNATNSYGVRVSQLLAPPPATPSALADVTAGQASVTLTLTGTTASGSGFFDPGANLASPARPFNHLAASITSGGATGTPPTVVSATYLTPTTVQLVLNASTATANLPGQNYTLTITNPDGQSASAAIVHVVGSLPSATIATGPSQAEGDVGNTPFGFTVNLSAASASPVVVRYETSNGTATVADDDYDAATDSITIAAGLTSGTITVNVKGDTKRESDESFGVTLTSASGANLGATVAATGTIQNDDAVPTMSIVANASASEGASGTTPLVFGVTLTNASDQAVSASWATSDNSATTADGDYAAASGTVTIPAGSTSGSLTVDLSGDAKYESNESFNVTLASPVNAVLGTAISTGTIDNDDAPPALSIDDVTALEGDSGTTIFHFTISLSAPSGLLTSFDASTSDGTATVADNDYAAGDQELAIAAGATSQTFDVVVNGDAVAESDETFTVTLDNVTGATLADATGTGTITNDDATPLLSIAAASLTEGDAGTTALTFTVSLAGTSGSDVTAHWATSDATATAGTDYVAASGTVTIPALGTSATITVDVNGDVCGEADETFDVTLSSPTGASIATATAAGTITNDDDTTAPAVSVSLPNGGETVEVATATDITWSASDNGAVADVDILLSRDGGATYTETIASAVPNSGSYSWTPTPPATTTAFVQVKAHDDHCNTGADVSDAAFEIADHVTAVAGAPVTAFALGGVRPNPSRGAVSFEYDLPRAANVRLTIVDVQGREVALIAGGTVEAGRHVATWSGVTPRGNAPRGLYFVRYQAGGRTFSRRFALIH